MLTNKHITDPRVREVLARLMLVNSRNWSITARDSSTSFAKYCETSRRANIQGAKLMAAYLEINGITGKAA